MDHLRERMNHAAAATAYGYQRIDLLVISISGAGVYICLETLKWLKENEIDLHWMIFGSGFFFIVAIMINFWSQFASIKVWDHDFTYFYLSLKKAEFKKMNLDNEWTKEQEENLIRHKAEPNQNSLEWLNQASAILMGLGVLTLLLYFAIVLPGV